MMATSVPEERPEKDIGGTIERNQPVTGDIESDEGTVLREIEEVSGHAQVTQKRLEFVPPWVIHLAIKQEHDNSWSSACREVAEAGIPSRSIMMSSHIIYKIKVSEDGKLKLKVRISPHGNREEMREDVRKDAAAAQSHVIRLILSIATCKDAKLGLLDISGAYMQSGPIKRDIYV